jgi:hypothetical protein
MNTDFAVEGRRIGLCAHATQAPFGVLRMKAGYGKEY